MSKLRTSHSAEKSAIGSLTSGDARRRRSARNRAQSRAMRAAPFGVRMVRSSATGW